MHINICTSLNHTCSDYENAVCKKKSACRNRKSLYNDEAKTIIKHLNMIKMAEKSKALNKQGMFAQDRNLAENIENQIYVAVTSIENIIKTLYQKEK